MAARFSSHLLRRHLFGRHFTSVASSTVMIPKSHPLVPSLFNSRIYTLVNHRPTPLNFTLRFLSTRSVRQARPNKPDIGARARQLQTRRLWTYALTFSCIAGFIIIVINQFQDQLVFYVTPTDALQKYDANPTKSKFRLGGLVLENSVAQIPSSPEIQFVVTDLITDILVKYEGSLPDLFREGHSVVVEGFIKPVDVESRKKEEASLGNSWKLVVSEKARNLSCYFSATEVLAKHDEKYMPAEVAMAIEKNKKKLKEEEEEKKRAEPLISADGDGNEKVMQLPDTVIKHLNRLCAGSFWGDREEKITIHWTTWKAMCLPKEAGGLGITNLKEMVTDFSKKLYWKVRSSQSLWENL